jgi:hypothetical protein
MPVTNETIGYGNFVLGSEDSASRTGGRALRNKLQCIDELGDG